MWSYRLAKVYLFKMFKIWFWMTVWSIFIDEEMSTNYSITEDEFMFVILIWNIYSKPRSCSWSLINRFWASSFLSIFERSSMLKELCLIADSLSIIEEPYFKFFTSWKSCFFKNSFEFYVDKFVGPEFLLCLKNLFTFWNKLKSSVVHVTEGFCVSLKQFLNNLKKLSLTYSAFSSEKKIMGSSILSKHILNLIKSRASIILFWIQIWSW